MQDPRNQERDASGNPRLQDVGVFLRSRITHSFAARGIESSIKYIDPSYIIRTLPAIALNAEFCLMLGQQAVHAGAAGRTDMAVGFWNQRFTHMPMALAVGQRTQLDPQGVEWQSVLQTTGQLGSWLGSKKLPLANTTECRRSMTP